MGNHIFLVVILTYRFPLIPSPNQIKLTNNNNNNKNSFETARAGEHYASSRKPCQSCPKWNHLKLISMDLANFRKSRKRTNLHSLCQF